MSRQSASTTPNAGALDSFFNAVANILGDDNVSRDHHHGALAGRDGKDSYGDAYSPSDIHQPSGAIRPSSVEEVQQVLKLANTHKVPLWTVSRGKNLGYGGQSPVVKGTIVLDLHRMNKIVEINGESGYAIVEPGVSFFDLYEEIQRQGLSLWPSVPAIGWGSVLGNTLDRGFGYTPNGEHSQSQCGMEVVLPKGDLLRTGAGAMKDNPAFALYKGGFGPSLDGLFYQSNFGVVTKLGMHITPAPEAYATLEVSVPREEDLVDLIGILSDLMRRSIILNSPSIANIFRIALTCKIPEVHARLGEYMKPGSHIPYKVLEEIREQQGWGFWRAYFSLYGSVEMLPALQKTVQRAFAAIPGAQVTWREFPGVPGKAITAAEIKEEEIPHSGIPTLGPLGIVDSRGESGGGHISFSPIIPPSGRELYAWYLTAKQRTIDANFDFFADFHVYPRYVVGIELVIYTLEEEERAHALYGDLLHDASEQGFMEYRTHVRYMDAVASKQNFNGSAFGRFTGLLKDTLDPNGILSPGKSGIWNSTESTISAGFQKL
ncbi:related to 4-cresol dehydrogenase flavoprotein subunit [Cephalotrichum gorgonifer]|uniref:Related to 4-cresol dehydrogenase flavoprotein subunit n=1 Tax=Cephalotrichum gorgonifer TaxID=2041049 RepID=A0AAE8T0D6_9PEZI|nr:related to 4-cresol dehydrogenase flavoprotein subunit [Cephalotrichum gorgonifer]